MPSNSHISAASEVRLPIPTSTFLRRIPTLPYTIQNILISLSTLAFSLASLIFTCSFILPLSLIRASGIIPKALMDKGEMLGAEGVGVDASGQDMKRGKVVVIVGASSGIGLEVLKQYVPEPNTTVIAMSKNADTLRQSLIDLGDTPASVQMEIIDLAAGQKAIHTAVEELDRKYGPISHLYAISGISNHLDHKKAWGMEVTEKMINVNVSGITALTMAMYERMKKRQYGKICIVGSVAGLYSPANMISYASTKAFINTFATSLRVLAAPYNVDVVCVQPGFIDTRMTGKMRGQGSTVPGMEFASAEEMAAKMKRGVEKGGVGVVSWPTHQTVAMYGLRSLNPICDELGRYVSMKSGMAGKKIT